MNRSFNIEDTQGPSLANVSFSQINRSQYREKEEEQGPGNYIDYNQAVNMLKSIPFGDDAVVKSMENIVVRRDNDDEELKLINSGLKSKTSKTAFLFRKNPLKSNHGQEGGYVKKHAKSKSLFSTSSGHKKNASVGKKFYTLGHNHSENSLNAGYFVPEKDNKYKGNYFSQEFETPYMIEEEEEVYQEEENNPMSRTEEVRKNESFPKRSGSNKSVKWLGKIMKTIQLKK
ncbi:hypothetical protein PIROE2DRAFT_66735 [Piromyces sp. E2]|nr:hypothetical protein PIROE2DRAFT_66735 [Piromyces sp. E2]|eukprot:OUM70144.1 hypothetical protein PIROE2DRAFT_66735 [Piromyces sp. E2]